MKKKGRGRDYKKALLKNLLKSLVAHKKIITTKAKAKRLKLKILKEHAGLIRNVQLNPRRGDNAPRVLLEWKKNDDTENKTNKKGPNKKKMASL